MHHFTYVLIISSLAPGPAAAGSTQSADQGPPSSEVASPHEGTPEIDQATSPPHAPADPARTSPVAAPVPLAAHLPVASPGLTALAPAPSTEEEWYVGQIGLVYAGSAGLLAVGASEKNQGVLAAGWLGVFLGPPILHFAHGRKSVAGIALGLRALLLRTVNALANDCYPLFGQSPDSAECNSLGFLTLAELIATPVVDLALAHKTVDPPRHPLSLVILPASRSRSGTLSLVGRF